MSPIRLKTLTRQIIALTDELGLKAVPEYKTPDGTRIDVAILNGRQKILAIELEASFKWFPQRLLYDVVKVHRAGFSELWVVTPFRTVKPGWVAKYAEEIGVELRIIAPESVEKEISKLRTSSLSDT